MGESAKNIHKQNSPTPPPTLAKNMPTLWHTYSIYKIYTTGYSTPIAFARTIPTPPTGANVSI